MIQTDLELYVGIVRIFLGDQFMEKQIASINHVHKNSRKETIGRVHAFGIQGNNQSLWRRTSSSAEATARDMLTNAFHDTDDIRDAGRLPKEGVATTCAFHWTLRHDGHEATENERPLCSGKTGRALPWLFLFLLSFHLVTCSTKVPYATRCKSLSMRATGRKPSGCGAGFGNITGYGSYE